MSDVLVCDDEKIINVDDDETVYVRRIRGGTGRACLFL
jgi:hypothetical protein